MTVPVRFRIVGPGRAGESLGIALARAGWERHSDVNRSDDASRAAEGVDLVVIAVPDGAIATVAAAIEPDDRVVIAHLAGSLGLDVLEPHVRRAALHPLVSLPCPEVGAKRLTAGAWFATAGDPLVEKAVADLDGRSFTIDDADRGRYHAGAAIASNHLVALLGQVERIADHIGMPLEAYLDLATATLANVGELGPAAALTGPVARGDWDTVRAHLSALPETERPAYRALATEAARLADRSVPPDVGGDPSALTTD